MIEIRELPDSLKDKIKAHDLVIFKVEGCEACNKAISRLKNKFSILELDLEKDKTASKLVEKHFGDNILLPIICVVKKKENPILSCLSKKI